MNSKEQEAIKKLEHLKTIGVEIQDEDGVNINFMVDGYDYSVEYNEFEIGNNLDIILSNSTLWGCCGTAINKDKMICPICKEHL